VAAAVGTRDARAVASHAQKWFVRLAMRGERVPRRVAESGGEGYTLSGRPLDARSATARAYGLKVGAIRAFLEEGREMPGMLLPLPPAEEDGAAAAAVKGGNVGKAGAGAGAGAGAEARAAPSGAANDENGGAAAGTSAAKKAETAGATAAAAAASAAASAAPAAAASGEAPTPSALVVAVGGSEAAAEEERKEAAPSADPPVVAVSAALGDDGARKEAEAEAAAAEEARGKGQGEKGAPAPPRAPFQLPPPPPPPQQPPPSPPRQLPERTEYALSRPRRAAPQRSAAAAAALRLGATSESLELLACREFPAALEPGCGLPLAQPFALEVSRAALAVMDLHAHLHHEEIIGLLGGRWESGRGGGGPPTVSVARAFPCARASGTGSRTSVELCAAAEVSARAAMAAAGLVPVGWYHSHPVFAPTPSRKDAENQRNYQALFRMGGEEGEEEREGQGEEGEEAEEGGEKSGAVGGGCCGGKAPKKGNTSSISNIEPFVGAIVGPYDQALPSPAAVTSWFCVAAAPAASATGGVGAGGVGGGAAAELAPFSLRCRVGDRAQCPPVSSSSSSSSSSDAVPSSSRLREALLGVARDSRLEADAVDLSLPWRSFSFASGGAPVGAALTKAEKARLSLARHLADGPDSERLLDEVFAELGVAVAAAVGLKKGGGEGEEKKNQGVVAVDE